MSTWLMMRRLSLMCSSGFTRKRMLAIDCVLSSQLIPPGFMAPPQKETACGELLRLLATQSA